MNDIVHTGHFLKEGSWVRSWKRRYFFITKDGKITYKESKDSNAILGSFDISGRLECSRFKDIAHGVGICVLSTSSGRKLNVVLDNLRDYKSFCIGIHQACRFHNIYVSKIQFYVIS